MPPLARWTTCHDLSRLADPPHVPSRPDSAASSPADYTLFSSFRGARNSIRRATLPLGRADAAHAAAAAAGRANTGANQAIKHELAPFLQAAIQQAAARQIPPERLRDFVMQAAGWARTSSTGAPPTHVDVQSDGAHALASDAGAALTLLSGAGLNQGASAARLQAATTAFNTFHAASRSDTAAANLWAPGQHADGGSRLAAKIVRRRCDAYLQQLDRPANVPSLSPSGAALQIFDNIFATVTLPYLTAYTRLHSTAGDQTKRVVSYDPAHYAKMRDIVATAGSSTSSIFVVLTAVRYALDAIRLPSTEATRDAMDGDTGASADDAVDTQSSASADTASVDTDSADTDSVDTDSADTDSVDTDSADTDSAESGIWFTVKPTPLSPALSPRSSAHSLTSMSFVTLSPPRSMAASPEPTSPFDLGIDEPDAVVVTATTATASADAAARRQADMDQVVERLLASRGAPNALRRRLAADTKGGMLQPLALFKDAILDVAATHDIGLQPFSTPATLKAPDFKAVDFAMLFMDTFQSKDSANQAVRALAKVLAVPVASGYFGTGEVTLKGQQTMEKLLDRPQIMWSDNSAEHQPVFLTEQAALTPSRPGAFLRSGVRTWDRQS